MKEDIDWNEWFYYDETSPSCLRWKVDRSFTVIAGDSCGYKTTQGYWSVMFCGKNTLQHRIIYELLNNDRLHDYFIDHIDGDRGNNLISNLRKVTHGVNNRNCKFSKNNTSGNTGVYSVVKHGYKYWVAKWRIAGSVQKHKHFRVDVFGEEEARSMAVQHRKDMLKSLNDELGMGYSERHIEGVV